MGRFIKSIVVGVLALSMATWGTPLWAVTLDSESISVSTTIAGITSGTITVELMESGVVSSATGIGFSGAGSAALASPWVEADQYLHISYTLGSGNSNWGIILYTDNVTLLGSTLEPVPVVGNADTDGDGSIWGDADDDIVYGGIINTSELTNPEMRGPLAWQVYDSDVYTTVTAPTATAVDTNTDGDSDYYDDDNVTADWAYFTGTSTKPADWAYVADLSNTDYSDTDGDGVYESSETVDDRRNDVYWNNSSGDYVLNYALTAYHTTFRTSLAHHPDTASDGAVRDITGDDLYLYLAGKFSSVGWSSDIDDDGQPFVLPSGDYATSITVELFAE